MPEDEALKSLVDRIFKQNLDHNDFSFVIGLALDTRRIDMLENAINKQGSTSSSTILTDTLNKVWESNLDIEFRNDVLKLIFKLFGQQREPDYLSMAQVIFNANSSIRNDLYVKKCRNWSLRIPMFISAFEKI